MVDVKCVACKGTGLKQPEQLNVCAFCHGVGPFDPDYPGQPDWRPHEHSRMIGNTKHYRSYSDFVG